MLCLRILTLFLPLLYARSTTSPQELNCVAVLKSAGATDEFGANVGHSIHSMTVRNLQKFEPSATEKNFVPTINMDLSSNEAVLPHAPDRRGPSESNFHSEGMKTLDEVLSHMDDENYDIKFFTPLEKVVHAFHMEEGWAMIHHTYEKLKAAPPSQEVCACAMDIESNGVLKMLRFTALAIREPQLIYGDNLLAYKKEEKDEYYVPYPVYTYHFKLQKAFKERDPELKPEQILMKEEQSMPRLTDAAAWQKWKKIGQMTMEEHSDVALFLYCALRKQ